MTTITDAASAALSQISDDQLAAIFQKFLENGTTMKDIQGLTRENLESVYAIAYNDYNTGKYERAHHMFQMLCFFDHTEKKYWMGLGATRQMLRSYDAAVDAYSMASMFDIEDPNPPLHAAVCHLALGNRDKAISGFQYAAESAGDRPEYAAIRRQAEAKLELLKGAGSGDRP